MYFVHSVLKLVADEAMEQEHCSSRVFQQSSGDSCNKYKRALCIGHAIGSEVQNLLAYLPIHAYVAPHHWFNYVVVLGYTNLKAASWWLFTKYIQMMDDNIIVTKVDLHNKLDCTISPQEGGCLKVYVYRKPTYTNQYFLFDCHRTLEFTRMNWPEFEPCITPYRKYQQTLRLT